MPGDSDKGCSYCVHFTFAIQKLETLSVRQKASLKAGHFPPLFAACTKVVRRQTPSDNLDLEFLIQALGHILDAFWSWVITFRGLKFWNMGCLCFLRMFPLRPNSGALCAPQLALRDMVPAQKKIKQDTTCWALFQRSCIISPSSLRVKDLCPQSSAHLQKARGGTQPSHAGQLGTSGTENCSGWSWFWIHLWSQSQHNCNALKKNKKKILSFLSTWLLTASAQLDHIHWILGEYQSLISPH